MGRVVPQASISIWTDVLFRVGPRTLTIHAGFSRKASFLEGKWSEPAFEDTGRWEPVPGTPQGKDGGGAGRPFNHLSFCRWCRSHVNNMKGAQPEDGRFARPIGPPVPSPLPEANGRAPAKDRTGSRKHKRRQPTKSYPTGTVDQGGNTHFLPAHLRLGEERGKRPTGPGLRWSSAPCWRPETAQHKGDVGPPGGPVPLQNPGPQSHTRGPEPTRSAELGGRGEEASLGFL